MELKHSFQLKRGLISGHTSNCTNMELKHNSLYGTKKKKVSSNCTNMELKHCLDGFAVISGCPSSNCTNMELKPSNGTATSRFQEYF